MLNISNDELSRVLRGMRINHRLEIWLWFYLQGRKAAFNPDDFDSPKMRDQMAAFIAFNDISESEIGNEMTNSLPPDENLKWIVNNDRQHHWLTSVLTRKSGMNPFVAPPRLLGRDLVIAIIDVWPAKLREKLAGLSEIENQWYEHKRQDASFRWFISKDESSRCEFAWEWLTEHKTSLTLGRRPIRNHQDLLIFFDHAPLGGAERTICIESIKKRWNQRQYRKNMAGKRQCNFILSDRAIGRLDTLAHTYELRRTEVLEILLKCELERGVYLTPRSRPQED